MKLWDFVCKNEDCRLVEERLVTKAEEESPEVCSECGSETYRSFIGGQIAFFDQDKRRAELKQRSHDHTAQAIKDRRPLTENESGKCTDPVWNNKLRAKNTSPSTISQHKYDHLK